MTRGSSAFLVAALALLMSPGCALFGRPTIKDVRPKIKGIDLRGVKFAFEIDVKNPYFVSLVSPGFRYGVDVEGEEFIAPQESGEFRVPAWGVGTVVLPVRFEYLDLIRAYETLRKLNQFTYRLHGVLRFRALGWTFKLPMSHEGTAPVVRLPRFTNIAFRVGRASLTSVTVFVEADMHNPNIFEIGVSQLGYVLRVGDTPVGDVKATTGGKIAAGESGRLTLTGRISAAGALLRLMRGEQLGKARIQPTGAIETPYGAVKLGKLAPPRPGLVTSRLITSSVHCRRAAHAFERRRA